MNWVLAIAVVFIALLLFEATKLRRSTSAISFRIVVTGTRGKSSLVRMLLAGIRTVEPATWGKITGDNPLSLAPDGTSSVLARRGPAHLREQAKFLISSRRRDARCVVMESMANSAEAMAAEMRLIRPDLVIVTNVRDDHRETLGNDPYLQRAAYLGSLPRTCRWLTLDARMIEFANLSGRYPAPIATKDSNSKPSGDERGGAPAETLATAEAALETLGWNTARAREAMFASSSQVVSAPSKVVLLGQEMTLLDAFSANDPFSLRLLWEEWRRDNGVDAKWSVLLNTRADRPLRTRQFCVWIAGRSDIENVYVAGSHRFAASRMLRRQGLHVTLIDDAAAALMPDPGEKPFSNGGRKVLVGLGNASGLPMRLRAAISRST
jgi:poly-gamma-glutamate synthase PgsB/CapB